MRAEIADAEAIGRRIARSEPCWWPGLAADLAADFWTRDTTTFSHATYGSWRWLCGDAGSARVALGHITCDGASPLVIERLPPNGARRYERIGLVLRDEGPDAVEADLHSKALAILGAAEGVREAVGGLVRCVHLLRSSGAGYDVSHSDPELPFSIFVSLPAGEPDAPMRLAESILHETMHLQLSLIERHAPIVRDLDKTAYSPWQNTARPIGGLVHGLYVFRAIDQWLACLPERQSDGAGSSYVQRRRRTIADEIRTAAVVARSEALTPFGLQLVEALIEPKWAAGRLS